MILVRISVAIGTLLVIGCAPSFALGGQDAATTPAAKSSTADQGSSSSQKAATGFFQRDELTGDWGGRRTRWKDKGVVLDSSLSQFEQGVAAGGVQTGSEYNGIAQAKLEIDLGKLAGWQFWSAEVEAQLRFGGPELLGTGSINPVNTAALIPAANGTVFALTAVNLTRLFPVDQNEGKFVAVSFGRFNIIDLLDEDFFAGAGVERFFNIAQIGPLTVLRQVPLITNAINVAYIRGTDALLTFSVMDPNDHSVNTGLSNLFADGVTLSPGVNVPTKYFRKTGKHSFGGAITTKAYTPFDSIRQIVLPGPPAIPLQPRSGSWSINYAFRQYIVERGDRDGWGFFTQVSGADRGTSPITGFFDAGLGGNGVFAARPNDEFGLAYAYTSLSQDLIDNLALLPLGGRLPRPEHQFEAFYNLHITPWLQLTGDLQIIRPTRSVADTAIVPGVRLRIVL